MIAAGGRRTGARAAGLVLAVIAGAGCSFDYGNGDGSNKDQADILMKDVEYVRVEGGAPLVRFKAEEAARYEDALMMELKNLSFEQFETGGETVSAVGSAGAARVDLNSGDINLRGGVNLVVDSEDLNLETPTLAWQDDARILSGGQDAEVRVTRSDGTNFLGRGFSADIRAQTWVFERGATGSYTEPEDEDEGEAESDSAETEDDGGEAEGAEPEAGGESAETDGAGAAGEPGAAGAPAGAGAAE